MTEEYKMAVSAANVLFLLLSAEEIPDHNAYYDPDKDQK